MGWKWFEKFHVLLYFSGEIWYNEYMKSTNNYQTSNPETVTISRAEYEEKNARLAAQDERIARLESQIELLTEALRLAKHKRFGASSEKTEKSVMEQLSFLFNEAEMFSTAEKEEPEATDVAGHKRHKKHTYTLDTIPEGIPTKQVEHRLEGEDLVCPYHDGDRQGSRKDAGNRPCQVYRPGGHLLHLRL